MEAKEEKVGAKKAGAKARAKDMASSRHFPWTRCGLSRPGEINGEMIGHTMIGHIQALGRLGHSRPRFAQTTRGLARIDSLS